jgi:hypothetical protein
MKKFLLLLFLFCGLTSFAAQTTVTFSESLKNGDTPSSINAAEGITLTFEKATGSNPPAYYTAGESLRFYKNNTLTITAQKDITIKSISYVWVVKGSKWDNPTVSTKTITNPDTDWKFTEANNEWKFTAPSKDNGMRSITIEYETGSTPVEPVEPVAPSELTVKYGDTSVSDDDEVSVTEGTEFNISAKDAAKITVTDREDNVLASADANKLTWTPEVMAENIITVTASNEKGNVSTVFSLTVTEKPFTAIDAIDILTVKSFNLSGNQYGEHTATVGNSTYKAYVNSNTASGSTIAANQIIGMRVNSSKGDGGIVTVESSGYAVKVCATQWENQSAKDPVYLKVYGQDIPYTNCKNVSSSKWGEELGEIALEKGVEKSLMLAKGYKYIAIMPKSGTIQLSEIKIQWASEKPILPEGGLDFTIDDTAFEIEADAVSAEIIVTGVHAESDLYYKFTATPAETAPESAPRKVADHAGYTKAERNSEGNHAISVSEAGTLELYAYHPATDSKSDVKTITVTKQSDTTAIDAIGADTAEGEAEYFNLQGVRINPENAAPGLYIRRQGGKAAKVLVKK